MIFPLFKNKGRGLDCENNLDFADDAALLTDSWLVMIVMVYSTISDLSFENVICIMCL